MFHPTCRRKTNQHEEVSGGWGHQHTPCSETCPLHLKDAHPVAGLRLQGGGEGVSTGDRGCGRVGLRDVDEQHLGEGACRGVGGRDGTLHADLGSVSVNSALRADSRCHNKNMARDQQDRFRSPMRTFTLGVVIIKKKCMACLTALGKVKKHLSGTRSYPRLNIYNEIKLFPEIAFHLNTKHNKYTSRYVSTSK